MFMVLGALLFLVVLGSAVLGVGMLFVAAGFCFRPEWRKWGTIILGAGVAGGFLGTLALFMLAWSVGNVRTPPETWVLFAAAGFGWASVIAAGVLAALAWLRLPNRWIDRRKAANCTAPMDVARHMPGAE